MKRRHSSTDRDFHPETLALGYGYDPWLSEGSIKPPVFLTSTFQFRSAAAGKHYFELAYGLQQPLEGEDPGLIYSRLNNPNLQMFEERMAAWDGMERGAVFASGMAAIATACLALVRPGDVLLTTEPVYGGTHYLFQHILPQFGIDVRFVPAGDDAPALMQAAAAAAGPERVKLLYVETPANPSLMMTDIASVSALARDLSAGRERPVVTLVDNTFLGPVFQRPADQGADLVQWFWRADRMGMAASMELRVPFCTVPMFSLANGIPYGQRLHGGERKAVLKKVAEKYVDHDQIYRKKVGFGLPIVPWSRTKDGYGELIRETFESSSFRIRPGIDHAHANALYREFRDGHYNERNCAFLWTYVNLEQWHRMFFENGWKEMAAKDTK